MIQKKIPVLGVSALLLLLALTIALTALVLNIDQLRSGLAAYITQQTERNVTIGSDVELGLGFSGSGSLLLTLKAEDVVVYNNPDFSAEPLFHREGNHVDEDDSHPRATQCMDDGKVPKCLGAPYLLIKDLEAKGLHGAVFGRGFRCIACHPKGPDPDIRRLNSY